MAAETIDKFCEGCKFNVSGADYNEQSILPATCQICFAGDHYEPVEPTLDRVADWEHFNSQMLKHIPQYTIVQYGNQSGDDQAAKFSVEDCWTNIQRYYNRRGSSTRGPKEKLRDVIKVAHYAKFIYDKLRQELNEPDVY